MLKDILPPKYRTLIYTALVVAGLLVGATQVGFAAAGVAQPAVVSVVVNVLAYLGAATGLVARANVPSQEPSEPI